MTIRALLIGTLIVALAQTGLMAKIITDRAARLNTGTEVLLETGFIDPRDLFRGHYTTLNLVISNPDPETVTIEEDIKYNDTVYAELTQSDGFAQVVAVTRAIPENAKGPILKGQAKFTASGSRRPRISFPFDRFYADKTRALELEHMQREQKLGVILSVAADGTGMVKGLTVEGQKFYEESLF